MKNRVLIIEDNKEIVQNMYDFFDEANYQLDSALDGVMGLNLALANEYSVIVLDLMLPGIDGINLCKKVRAAGKRTPIIMLTARDTIEERVYGLESGADDYLVKPFSLAELKARIDALFRRQEEYQNKKTIIVGELVFEEDSFQISKRNQVLQLTPVLLKALQKLMKESPKIVTKRELEYSLWDDNPPSSDSLRTHIHSLRNIIDKPFNTETLLTVHGIGYKLLA